MWPPGGGASSDEDESARAGGAASASAAAWRPAAEKAPAAPHMLVQSRVHSVCIFALACHHLVGASSAAWRPAAKKVPVGQHMLIQVLQATRLVTFRAFCHFCLLAAAWRPTTEKAPAAQETCVSSRYCPSFRPLLFSWRIGGGPGAGCGEGTCEQHSLIQVCKTFRFQIGLACRRLAHRRRLPGSERRKRLLQHRHAHSGS